MTDKVWNIQHKHLKIPKDIGYRIEVRPSLSIVRCSSLVHIFGDVEQQCTLIRRLAQKKDSSPSWLEEERSVNSKQCNLY